MPKYDKKEILKMLKLVQQAQKEITKERSDGEKTMVLGTVLLSAIVGAV